MKKVVLITRPWFDKILTLPDAVREAGYDVIVVSIPSFNESVSYIGKKLDEWGFKSRRRKYRQYWFEVLQNILQTQSPDIFLFINPAPVTETAMKILKNEAEKKSCRFISWIVDPMPISSEFCKLFDAVYSMEKKFCRDGLEEAPVGYIPLGYSNTYKTRMPNMGGQWDIVFVGSARKNRFPYLDVLAKAARKNDWKFRCDGIFYEKMYFWKKIVFQLRHKDLAVYTTNHTLSPYEVANIYRNSRIVLNLHGNGADSPNPRTYDILATGAFELVDTRRDYDILRPGQDLDIFDSPQEMVEKIEYYLKHEGERLQIAKRGHEKVLNRRSLTDSIRMLLKE